MASIMIAAEAVKDLAKIRIDVIDSLRQDSKEKEIKSVMAPPSWVAKKLGAKQKTREEAEAIVDKYPLFDSPWKIRYDKQREKCKRIMVLAETALIQGKKEMILTDEDLYWLE